MQVTARDQQKARRLIRRLTPSASLYSIYEDEAEAFIQDFKHARRDIPANLIETYRLEMRDSRFFGRKYLVAFMSEGWFHQTASHCNAVASPSMSFMDLTSPPLVVIPGKSIPRTRGFSSILEHEFVHVNQAIHGKFPRIDDCELRADVLFDELINVTVAEYEANFIQLVHDQSQFPDAAHEVGLEKWCHLRGYTQGLETALLRLSRKTAPLMIAKKLVTRIEHELPNAFARAKLSERVGTEFAQDVEQMFKIAMCVLIERNGDLPKLPPFRKLGQWIFRNHVMGS